MTLPNITEIKQFNGGWTIDFDDNTSVEINLSDIVVSKYSNHTIILKNGDGQYGVRFFEDAIHYWDRNGTMFSANYKIPDSEIEAFEDECLKQANKSDVFDAATDGQDNVPAWEAFNLSFFEKSVFSKKNGIFTILTMTLFLLIDHFDLSGPRYSASSQFAAYLIDNNAILGGVILLAYFASPIFAFRIPIRFSLFGSPVKIYSPWFSYVILLVLFAKYGFSGLFGGLAVVYAFSFCNPEILSRIIKKIAGVSAFAYMLYLSEIMYRLRHGSWVVAGFALFVLLFVFQFYKTKKCPAFMQILFLCQLCCAGISYGGYYIKDYFFHKVYVVADNPQVYRILNGTEKYRAIEKRKCAKSISGFCAVKTKHLLKKGDYLKCDISTRGDDLCAFGNGLLIANKVVTENGERKITENVFSKEHAYVKYETFQETPAYKRIWNGKNCLKNNPVKELTFCIAETEKLKKGIGLHCEKEELEKLGLCRMGDLYVKLSDLDKNHRDGNRINQKENVEKSSKTKKKQNARKGKSVKKGKN